MNQVKFYYGRKGSYDVSSMEGGIYFAYDTSEILLEGQSYGGGVDGVTLDGNTMTFTGSDGTNITVIFPNATEEANGWMSAEDKAALDNMANDIKNAIDALNYSDSVNGFVSAVNEAAGVISVTHNQVISDDSSVIVTQKENGDINLSTSGVYNGVDAINVNHDDYKVSLVIDGEDEVLSQSGSGLKTTLSVNYTESDHMINLCGIDGAVISSFDARAFIVEGILKDVEVVDVNPETGATGKFLELTWIVSDGSGGYTTKTVYIDVTEMIDTYTAGNGLELNGYKFSVKIADSDEGYLQVTEAGLKTEGISTAITEAVTEETSRAEAAEAALEEALEKASAAATTEVEKDSNANHLTLTSSTGSDGQTIYTIGESDIASESTVSNVISSVGLNSDGSLTDVTLPGGASTIVDAVKELAAEIVAAQAAATTTVEKDSNAGHLTLSYTQNSDGSATYTIGEKNVADADIQANMISAVGLDTDGSHKVSEGTYTSSADSIEGEILALDTEIVADEARLGEVESLLTWIIVE